MQFFKCKYLRTVLFFKSKCNCFHMQIFKTESGPKFDQHLHRPPPPNQVAVRVRVFNEREKTAGASRIVRMENHDRGSKTFITDPDTGEERCRRGWGVLGGFWSRARPPPPSGELSAECSQGGVRLGGRGWGWYHPRRVFCAKPESFVWTPKLTPLRVGPPPPGGPLAGGWVGADPRVHKNLLLVFLGGEGSTQGGRTGRGGGVPPSPLLDQRGSGHPPPTPGPILGGYPGPQKGQFCPPALCAESLCIF